MPLEVPVGDCCTGSTQSYLDESYRLAEATRGFYLFGAVSIDALDEEATRSTLRKATGKMPRLHWRTDSDAQREQAIATLAKLESLSMMVFVQEKVPQDRQERYRQHALWNVVPDLAGRCAHNLVFEARERSQDDIDSKTLGGIARSGAGGPKFSYTVSRPLDEPLLWLPDVMLGATGMMLTGTNTKWWSMLANKPELIELNPP